LQIFNLWWVICFCGIVAGLVGLFVFTDLLLISNIIFTFTIV